MLPLCDTVAVVLVKETWPPLAHNGARPHSERRRSVLQNMYTRSGVNRCGSQRSPVTMDWRDWLLGRITSIFGTVLSWKMLAASDCRRRISDAAESARAVGA